MSHDFWRQIVRLVCSSTDVFLIVLNIQIIQKTISKHYPLSECRKTSAAEYISPQTDFVLFLLFLVSFGIYKFELQYEWTPPQIFFCGYRILQLFSEVFYKKDVLKNFAMFTRKHLCQSLFLSCNFVNKETLAQRFFCEFCKIFKNSFLQNTSRWILLFFNRCWLCTLQLYIAGNFQVMKSH